MLLFLVTQSYLKFILKQLIVKSPKATVIWLLCGACSKCTSLLHAIFFCFFFFSWCNTNLQYHTVVVCHNVCWTLWLESFSKKKKCLNSLNGELVQFTESNFNHQSVCVQVDIIRCTNLFIANSNVEVVNDRTWFKQFENHSNILRDYRPPNIKHQNEFEWKV